MKSAYDYANGQAFLDEIAFVCGKYQMVLTGTGEYTVTAYHSDYMQALKEARIDAECIEESITPEFAKVLGKPIEKP